MPVNHIKDCWECDGIEGRIKSQTLISGKTFVLRAVDLGSIANGPFAPFLVPLAVITVVVCLACMFDNTFLSFFKILYCIIVEKCRSLRGSKIRKHNL